jgi:hypothetical protein
MGTPLLVTNAVPYLAKVSRTSNGAFKSLTAK